jgi:hypothetical protein
MSIQFRFTQNVATFRRDVTDALKGTVNTGNNENLLLANSATDTVMS